MEILKAIIVEDEPTGLENLRWKIQQNCPEIEIVAECMNGKSAIQAINRHLPDILFLDILLGDMSGFDVLKAIRHPSFDVIFTTSYDEYAIEAIRNSAVDYLLKPVDLDELLAAVAKVRSKRRQVQPNKPKVATPSSGGINRMGFPISTGKQFIDIQEVIYAKAEDNIAILHLKTDRKTIRLTKSLSWLEEQLAESGFCRVHHSYLINLNHITEYIRNDGGFVIMSNKKAISVARRRKDEFFQKLENWNA